MSWKLWGLNISDVMGLFCISLMQSRNSVLSCWWVREWEPPLAHKPNQTEIGASISKAAEAGKVGQALSWKVNVAEPLAQCSSAVPRERNPISACCSPVSSLPPRWVTLGSTFHLRFAPKPNGTESGTGKAKAKGIHGVRGNLLAPGGQ